MREDSQNHQGSVVQMKLSLSKSLNFPPAIIVLILIGLLAFTGGLITRSASADVANGQNDLVSDTPAPWEPLEATADHDVDSSFVTRLFGGVEQGTGVDISQVKDTVIQPDGKTVAVGRFRSFANRIQRGVARVNADGSPDYGFYPQVNGDVEAVALQTDGKVLIAGDFTQVGGQTRSRLARLNSDGSLDTTFLNPSVNERAWTVAVQPDGKILVGGDFDNVGGQTRNSIARINVDGTIDTAFNAIVSANSSVYTISVTPDNKILVGGDVWIGNNSSYLGRFNSNGSLDTSWVGRIPDDVWHAQTLPNGKILISGSFAFIGPAGSTISRSRIARLNADGSPDTGFRNITEISASTIYDLDVQTDGKIVFGGSLSYQSFTKQGLARVDADGNFDDTYDPQIGGVVGTIYTVSMQPDNKAIIGGNFNSLRGISKFSFARINPDGSQDIAPKDLSLGSSTSQYGWLRSIAVQPDGKILVGGYFESAGGRRRRGVARLNTDGTIDNSFADPGITNFFYTSISALVVQPDGKILVGGDFDQVNGQTRRHIIRLNPDGTLDAGFAPDVSDVVYSIALQPDGKILIGGFFYQVNGQDRSRLARLNSDGSLDTAFNRGTDFAVAYNINVLPDGKILAPGSQVGQPNGLFRYNSNGTRDTSFTITSTAGGTIARSYVQPDGKIVVTGPFYEIGGQSRSNIARLNPDGSLDTTFSTPNFGQGTSAVYDIAIQTDGRILMTGAFNTVNGEMRESVARLQANGSLDPTFASTMATVGTAEVHVVRLDADQRILLGGNFTEINGIGADYLVRLNNGNADPCTLTTNPAMINIPGAGGAGNFQVITGPNCAWAAAANVPWINVQENLQPLGTGSGTVTYTVAPNPAGEPRTGGITVSGGGQTVSHTVNQAAGGGTTPSPTPTISPSPTPTPSGSGIQDGGFELNTNNGTNPHWTSSSALFGSSLCTPGGCGSGTTARNGDGWVWFDGAGNGNSAENGTASQTVQFPIGGTVTLNYYLRIPLVTSPSTSVFTVAIDGNVVQTINEPSTAEADYTLRTVDLSPYANGGQRTISFNYTRPAGTSGSDSFNVDDVSLDIVASTPTPTPSPSPTPTIAPSPTPTVTPSPTPGQIRISYPGQPVAITDNDPNGVNLPVVVAAGQQNIPIWINAAGTITDLNFQFDGTINADPNATNVGVNHSWVGDLKFTLTSPSGKSVVLIDRPGFPASGSGCSSNNFANLILDDEGGFPPIEDQCGADGDSAFPSGTFTPNNPLSAFDGENSEGTWTLNISDHAGQDTGTARAFSLIFTLAAPAASATVSGQVFGSDGRALRNAKVSITDQQGNRQIAITSSAGFYTFSEVTTGKQYTVAATSKRFRFSPRQMTVNGNMNDINFLGLE
jgi:uncharacterized delta-60 repeat protein